LTDNVTQAPSAGRSRASRPGGDASRSGGTAGRSGGTASRQDTGTGVTGRAGEGRSRGAGRTGNGGRALSGSAESGAESGRAGAERVRRPSADFAPSDAPTSGAAGDKVQVRIVIPEEQSMVSLLGSGDELLRVIEDVVSADFHVRGNEITVTGPEAEVAMASRLFEELLQLTGGGAQLDADAVERSISMLRRRSGVRPAEVLNLDILSSRGRTIRPKTLNQKRYVDAIDQHTVVFSIGPAGTGKTYLAMAKAVKALQAKEVNRIILTRPAVEAGERLGFLPGTLYEKIDPYLRPLYDALHDMVDPESIPRLLAAGTIEIAPLAYMRGRTLNDSFIILDEAQNTSPEQMKMFLTRLGFGSRVVVTGDVTQVDLPAGQASGLRQVQEILDGVEDVYFCRLTSHDVVRHKLVADIVDAYERYDAARQATEPGRLPAGRSRRDGYRGR
jgi:phosphate starvation-inducible protein PhoH and related proteins